jgi:hypothetical protein
MVLVELRIAMASARRRAKAAMLKELLPTPVQIVFMLRRKQASFCFN